MVSVNICNLVVTKILHVKLQLELEEDIGVEEEEEGVVTIFWLVLM